MKKSIALTILAILATGSFVLMCSEPVSEESLNVIPNLIGIAALFGTYKLGEFFDKYGILNDNKQDVESKLLLTPEQHDSLQALIDELDLEVVEVRRDA